MHVLNLTIYSNFIILHGKSKQQIFWRNPHMTSQEEVRRLILTYEISNNWLAKKLGLKEETLHYVLYESPKFDEELLRQIKDLIETYQFELNLFDVDTREDMNLFTDEKLQMEIGR